MRCLILVALLCGVLAMMLHSTNAQMRPQMPMPGGMGRGFVGRERRAAQGGGAGGGAGAGMGFDMGAKAGAGGGAGGQGK